MTTGAKIENQHAFESLDLEHLSAFTRVESAPADCCSPPSNYDMPVVFGERTILQHFSEHESASLNGTDIDFGSQRLLGVGSVAYVLKGKWRKNSVAVKTLRLEEDSCGAVSAPDYAADLATELDVVSMHFNHPNITKFLGAGTMEFNGQNLPMIVYERVRGGSAEQLYASASEAIGKAWVPERAVALSLCQQLYAALSYLHNFDTPIAHRDVKPANLLLSEDCTQLKLADFSLACPIHGKASDVSDAPSVAGSARYMAPEVSSKSKAPLRLDKADIYSAAMTSWFLIFGKRPFPEMGDPAMAHVLACQFVRPPVKDPKLCALLSSAWDHNPSARPAAADLANSFAAMAAEKGSQSLGKRIMLKAVKVFARSKHAPAAVAPAPAGNLFSRTKSAEAVLPGVSHRKSMFRPTSSV